MYQQRPFPIAESDKPIMHKQMKGLVALGILTENSTSHTSPVMLITRKLTSDKRPVVDFRVLNTRILKRNTATLWFGSVRCFPRAVLSISLSLESGFCQDFTRRTSTEVDATLRLGSKTRQHAYGGLLWFPHQGKCYFYGYSKIRP